MSLKEQHSFQVDEGAAVDHPRKRVAIQRNPLSGAGQREHELLQLVQGLTDAGLTPEVYSDRGQLDAQLQSPEFRDELLCIVAAGGDGTVDDLINRHPEIPLAIFAMGTENLLAKHFQIPLSGRLVAELIAARQTRRIDVGIAGTRRFAVMASCGFDAAVVQLAHATRRGRITKLHYIKPILRSLARAGRLQLQVFIEQAPEPVTCQMVVLANLPRYALNLPICPEADETDGQFEVCLVKSASPLRLILAAATGWITGRLTSSNYLRLRARSLRIAAELPVAVQADGDPVGQTPMHFELLPQALQLIVPPAHATSRLS